MPVNANSTATCDRCGLLLPAYGAIHGLILASANPDGTARNRILCYANRCAATVLAGMVLRSDASPANPVCSTCGRVLGSWSTSAATLGLDVNSLGDTRPLAFCNVEHAAVLLGRVTPNV